MNLPETSAGRLGLLAWFAGNPVAANLLMLLILIGGLSSYMIIDTEVFPRFSPHIIEINAIYSGAGPLEIEESVCVRIEEAVFDAPGVKRLNTEISQGLCQVRVAVLPDYDKEQVMSALRMRVQALSRLPKALEKIDVQPATRDDDDGVIWVALHGPTDALTLKRFGEQIQQQLAAIPGVVKARNYGEIPYEIAIEVSSIKLQQYRLSLHDIAEALRRTSLDLPGGLVKTPAGELLLKVKGKAMDASALGALVLRTHADGTRLLLGQVAVIKDGVEERLSEWHYNGETGQGWEIRADHNTVEVAQRVNDYVQDMQAQLPEGLALRTWWDDSQAYQERVRTLVEDGLSGFVLVCLVLTLFLRLRVAIWAGAGILTPIFGALWLMPFLDVSLNMLSLFGFLLAMGILVDDAIIIGESIYTQQTKANVSSLTGAIRGVQEVALPVTLAVLVALVAFLPGLFLSGWVGQMMRPICLVMILTLIFSLIEAMLILPAHLAVAALDKKTPSRLDRLRTRLNYGLDGLVSSCYRPALTKALEWRYLTVACFMLLLLISGALVTSDRVRQSFQPDVAKDSFWVNLTVPDSAPYSEISALSKQVEGAFFELRDELDGLSPQNRKQAPDQKAKEDSVIVGLETMVWENGAGFWTEFSALGRQRVIVEDFVREWRKRIGDIGRAKVDFLYKEGDVPYDIELDLGADNPETLAAAVLRLEQKLAGYPGVYDVVDSAEPGKSEVRLNLKPEAERLGLRLEDLAEQVRYGYYGEEVQRLQRGRSEVKVMVRLPKDERQSLDNLRMLPVNIAGGVFAPLGSLAEIKLAAGYAKLIRQDRHRVLKVQARVDPKLADINAIYADLKINAIKNLQQQF
ncbi:MAG: efflux RND transporter permease subunit, partial [Methylovulum sp.]